MPATANPPATPQINLMSIADILQDAEPCSIVEDVLAILRSERERDVVDRDQARLNDAWSRLAHQVVGQERF